MLAQESGLVLVIVLLGIALAVFGGNKSKRVQDPQTGAWNVVEVNKFLDVQNLVLLVKDASFIAVMAVGMTAIIVMGGIDLSVGSTYALSALVGGIFLRHNWTNAPPWLMKFWSSPGPNPRHTAMKAAFACLLLGGVAAAFVGALNLLAKGWGGIVARTEAMGRRGGYLRLLLIAGGVLIGVAALWGAAEGVMWVRSAPQGSDGLPLVQSLVIGVGVCCLVGALCGLVNGALIVGLKVHPFIITLGMMAVLRGLSFVLTQGMPVSGFPDSFTKGFFKKEMLKDALGGVYPVPVLVMVVVAALGAFLLARTVLGRRVYAIGGNETAAHYAGIPVGRVKIIMYTLMGLLAGLSACMYLGYLGAGSSDAGQGYELSVIAAAVIGGASLSGGRGSAVGAVLGAVLIQLINNAMIILDIDTNYTNIVMGAAIVAAVVLDQAKARLMPGAR